MARRRPKIYQDNPHRASMILTTLVVLVLLIVVSIGSYSLRERLDTYRQREAALEEQIAAEKERAIEIENQGKYTHTMKYVEEIARKRLGLVYEGEIIFRQGN